MRSSPKVTSSCKKMMLNIQVACTGLIERAWVELKRYSKVKPLDKSDLVGGIVEFWSRRMTQEKCIKHIEHMHKLLPKVAASQGRRVDNFL